LLTPPCFAQAGYIKQLTDDCNFAALDSQCPYVTTMKAAIALVLLNLGLLYCLSMERWIGGIAAGVGSVAVAVFELVHVHGALSILEDNFAHYDAYKTKLGHSFFGAAGADSIRIMSGVQLASLVAIICRLLTLACA
jgi:hypothetical protein